MRADRLLLVTLGALVLMLGTRTAHAQYNVPSQASGESRNVLVVAEDTPAAAPPSTPIGWELGASLDFLTSDPILGDKKLKFTDVVLFRVHGLLAIGRRLELFAGVDLLPKQPSYTDELVWQGGLFGLRYRVTETVSVYARGQGGPNLKRDGSWVAGETAIQYKRDLLDNALFWESALGGTYTQLLLDDPVARRPVFQTELVTRTGLAIREKHGVFASWLTFEFDFPLAAHPRPSADPTARALDPQTRVGVSLGMLLGVSRSLDLFIEFSVLDRGDIENPNTTLPILSGGFDQNRILFGFNRRFGERRRVR